MNQTRRQHTVPKCYLKNFSDTGHNLFKKEKKANLKQEEILKDLNKPVSLKIATVVDDFYTVDSGNDPMLIETRIYANEIENRYPAIYNLLIDPSINGFDMMERPWILSCLLSLHCRTPKQFRLFELTIPESHTFEKDIILEDYKGAHLLRTFPKFMETHEFKRVIIAKITDTSEFITCDNPLLIIGSNNTLKNNSFEEQFNSENLITIPLDKKHCCILTHARDKHGTDAEGKVYYNKIERMDVDASFSNSANMFILDSADKYYYGSEKYMKAFFSLYNLV
jgi:hypothetical protein